MDFCSQLSVNLLIDALKKDAAETNVVTSPLSYNIMLNMITGGASGSTLTEMLEFLQYEDINEVNSNSAKMMSFASRDYGDGPVIQCLSGVWLHEDYRLKHSYQELCRKIYNARFKSVDFVNKADEVVNDANAWAKASTKGLVTEVLKHGDLDYASLLLGNALYFKGNWKDGFVPEYTMNKHFYLLNGSHKSLPFMTGCETYSHGSFDGFELVKIPYQCGGKKKTFSMYIFLPNERDGLESLLNTASASDGGYMQQDFKLNEWDKYDSFWIPKFKFSYKTYEGKQTMMKMGLRSLFDPNTCALDEMIDGRQHYVSNIVQKSFIEVDEQGTEAAAVTFEEECDEEEEDSLRERKEFIADHPFMFMIREDKSKFILFIGVVLDPEVIAT